MIVWAVFGLSITGFRSRIGDHGKEASIVQKVGKGKAVPLQAKRFQEVKVPRFHDKCTGWW